MSGAEPRAPRSDLERDDRETRRAVTSELERPLVVEAGAGTGKTAVLVARFLAWTLGPGWDARERDLRRHEPGEAPAPREVAARVLARQLAITFTEAAAREMQERIRRALAELRDGVLPVGFEAPPAPTAAERAAACLEAADGLRVRTLHSFARGLLGRHPLEAGLPLRVEVDADGSLRRRAARAAVRRSLQRHCPPDGPTEEPWTGFLRLGVDPEAVSDAVDRLVSLGLAADDLGPDLDASARWTDLALRAAGATERMRTLLAVAGSGGGRGRARAAADLERSLGRLERRLRAWAEAPPDPERLRRRLGEALEPAALDRLAGWAAGRFGSDAEATMLARVRDRLVPAAAELAGILRHGAELDPAGFEAGRRLVGNLLDEVRRELDGAGILAYGDLVPRALRMLDRHPALLARLRSGLDQVLVDELQDTDRDQIALLRRIALEGPSENRPVLFVVGDPKQSIYGWRQADLRAWEDLVGAVGRSGGAHRVLSRNFRSVPAILEETHRVVAPTMVPAAGIQPPFRPLAATRPALADPAGGPPVVHWHLWLPDAGAPDRPGSGDAAATSRLEARMLAADLRRRHQEGISWSEMAVLARSLTDVEPLQAALREAGIPSVAGRDRRFWRRREVRDALCLLRTVLFPEDSLSLAGWLRSAAVGLPDAALLPLWVRGLPELQLDLDRDGPPDAVRRLVEGAAAHTPPVPGSERLRAWPSVLVAALGDLGRWRRAFEEEAPRAFVARLRRESLLEGVEAARWLGRHRAEVLDRFWERALPVLEEEGRDRAALAERLDSLAATDDDDGAERPGSDDPEAVRISSIHGAKGLEFSHVALVQTHRPSAPERTAAADAERLDDGWEVRLFGRPSPGFDRVLDRRRRVERAERVRLLYVALTRARDTLVISGRPTPDTPEDPAAATTLADLLGLRDGNPSAADRLAAWAAGRDRWVVDGVEHVFPARVLPEDRRQPPRSTAGEIAEPLSAPPGPRLRSPISWTAGSPRLTSLSGLDDPSGEPFVVAEHSSSGRTPLRAAGPGPSEPDPPGTAGAPGGARPRVPGSETGATEPAVEVEGAAALRSAARAGAALHALFAELDPGLDEATARHRWPERIVALLGETDEATADRARSLARQLAGSDLHARIRDLAADGRLVARALPVHWAVEANGTPDRRPTIAVGVLDLLYRQPEGGLVLVDLRSERPRPVDSATLAEAARRRAAAAAGLGAPIAAVELWYVRADRVVRLADPQEGNR